MTMTPEEKIIRAIEDGKISKEQLKLAMEGKAPIPDELLDMVDGGLIDKIWGYIQQLFSHDVSHTIENDG